MFSTAEDTTLSNLLMRSPSLSTTLRRRLHEAMLACFRLSAWTSQGGWDNKCNFSLNNALSEPRGTTQEPRQSKRRAEVKRSFLRVHRHRNHMEPSRNHLKFVCSVEARCNFSLNRALSEPRETTQEPPCLQGSLERNTDFQCRPDTNLYY